MNTLKRTLCGMALPALAAVLAGCGPTAYKITPIPADRTLQTEVVIDQGLFAKEIALIEIDGVIMNTGRFSLFGEGENPVSLFSERLDKAAAEGVAAVVLRINSPGGGVTASDVMYTELLAFKQRTGRPVVAVLMDTAASGGYYVACGADEIVAQPTTVTGSIGVIMQMVNFNGAMGKIGVESNAIVSGPMKDAGSPLRRLRPEEREVFQTLVNQMYDRFVKVVATGRKMDEAKVRELADGRVYSASQAVELGFVDRIATLKETLAAVQTRIGAKRVRVVCYKRPTDYKPNVYAAAPAPQPQVNMVNIEIPGSLMLPQAQFMYLWAPGY